MLLIAVIVLVVCVESGRRQKKQGAILDEQECDDGKGAGANDLEGSNEQQKEVVPGVEEAARRPLSDTTKLTAEE